MQVALTTSPAVAVGRAELWAGPAPWSCRGGWAASLHRWRVTRVAVRRLLSQLRDAGLVVSTRGRGSGWSLRRPATEITLLDVHDALAHGAPFALHPHEPNLECPVGFGIRPVLAEVYAGAEAAISNELRSRPIVDLLDQLLREHPLPAVDL